MKLKCKCVIGEENLAVKINNIFERNGFIYLWDKLNNKYVDKKTNKEVLEFPTWFVVCPTSKDPRYENDLVCMASDDSYCNSCSISLKEAAFLFSLNKKCLNN